jgi:carbamoyltransferase
MNNSVIGIHSGHNSAVSLVENGSLVFAIQEERLTRVKNQGGLPTLGLYEIFKNSDKVTRNSYDTHVAYGWRAIYTHSWERERLIKSYGLNSPTLSGRMKSLIRKNKVLSELINRKRTVEMENKLKSLLDLSSVRINHLEHHLCHASSAYFGWGKMDEKILVITCDGSGDGICASVSIGYKGGIERIAEVEETHSIGRLYATVTYLFGMMPLEHEYKVMGLAPYAERSKESVSIANELETLFIFDRKNPFIWRRNGCPPMQYSPEFLAKLLKLKRFDHIAGGVQLFMEKFLVRWIRSCILETGIKKVALGGGVFMNVKANQKILEIPELEELFIFPSCGDETNAIGSAYFHYNNLFQENPKPLSHFYLGDEFSNDQVESVLSKYKFRNHVKVGQVQDMEKKIAELLARGEIVARFKGRMEFGARALGNRSILANPSDPKSVRVINEMIKSRDFWMPFAPSVLAERSDDYFIKPKDMRAPYMIITFDTKQEKRDKIIAAIHPYDYTGRPQEVYEEWNPSYYRLLKYFESITGEGIILNTSFNLHGEPIVHSPGDALRVFDISGLKYLAMENFLLAKN